VLNETDDEFYLYYYKLSYHHHIRIKATMSLNQIDEDKEEFEFESSPQKHANLANNQSFKAIFQLHGEKLANKAFEIFESLDYDNSESADFFKEKCSEMPSSQLIALRDPRLGNEGRTLLHNAARKGSLSAVLSLIRAGHAIEPYDSCVSKVTPLMDAITFGHIEVAVVLIEAGSSLFTADVNRENGFHYAARAGNSRMLRSIVASSKFNRESCIKCASQTTIKKRLPEELATTPMMKEIMRGLRESGHHGKIFSRNR
jgi:ankyrin repeat protein